MDPFSGSGTTHAACIETGRAFTGAGMLYDDIRERRIAAASAADICVLPGVSDESVAVWQAEAHRVEYRPSEGQLDLLDAA